VLSVIDAGPPPAVPTKFNMAQHVLAFSVERCPEKLALQILTQAGSDDWTYARLTRAVQGCGAGLLALGLVPGDRVLIRLGSQVAFPILFLGALSVGLVPVATSAQLTTAEITPMTAHVRPQLIVATAGVALPDAPACPVLTDADIMAMHALAPAPWHMGDPDRPGYIIFTSGTSGRPMAVVHAHRAIIARQMMHTSWEGLTPDDRLMHAGALNWTYTLGTGLMDPWTVGATALIPGAGVGVGDLPTLAARHCATILAAAPGVLRQMLRAPLPALPALRQALSAGEALHPAIRQAWTTATGTPVCQALGMSEISTFVSESPDRPAPVGASGFAQTGRRIAALGADLTPVPRGTPGQLAVDRRDPGLMLGYLGASDPFAGRLSGDWFLTGDQVVIDANGAVTYLGRIDDQINAGGYRVSPLEVETAMALCPGITDVAVTEVQIRPGVQVIGCFYTGSQALDDAQLSAHAASVLARYKQPRVFQYLAALPRGANAKLNRRALRDLEPHDKA
jgi:acyl-coenzyme A synthetase/AMP-(fatty) acid ligase